MKQYIHLLVGIFILTASQSLAQVYIYHNQEVKGIWQAKNSPYIIMGEAIVPLNDSLKIEAGVKVQFKTSSPNKIQNFRYGTLDVGFLNVKGTLIADGRSYSPIEFTRIEDEGYWAGIFFDNSDNSYMNNCIVEYAYRIEGIINGKIFNGALSYNFSNGTINNSIVRNNYQNGIDCENNSNPFITNTQIFNNKNIGIVCVVSNPKIDKTFIVNNQVALLAYNNSAPEIKNSVFKSNKYLFLLNKSEPEISYSCIDGALDPEIVDGGNNITKDPLFIDYETFDFRFAKNSPCIGAGENGINIGFELIEDIANEPNTKIIIDEEINLEEENTEPQEPFTINRKEKDELKKLQKKEFSEEIEVGCGDTLLLANLKFEATSSNYLDLKLAEADLNALVKYMSRYPNSSIELHGHTDYGRNTEALKRLSEQRVNKVKEDLIKKGIPISKIEAKYFGGSKPVILNDDVNIRSINRRVEVIIHCN